MMDRSECRDAWPDRVASWLSFESLMAGRLPKCSSTGSEIADKELMSEEITSGGGGAVMGGALADLAEGERRLAELDGGRSEVFEEGCRNCVVAPETISTSILDRSVRAPISRLQGKIASRHANESENIHSMSQSRRPAQNDKHLRAMVVRAKGDGSQHVIYVRVVGVVRAMGFLSVVCSQHCNVNMSANTAAILTRDWAVSGAMITARDCAK